MSDVEQRDSVRRDETRWLDGLKATALAWIVLNHVVEPIADSRTSPTQHPSGHRSARESRNWHPSGVLASGLRRPTSSATSDGSATKVFSSF